MDSMADLEALMKQYADENGCISRESMRRALEVNLGAVSEGDVDRVSRTAGYCPCCYSTCEYSPANYSLSGAVAHFLYLLLRLHLVTFLLLHYVMLPHGLCCSCLFASVDVPCCR